MSEWEPPPDDGKHNANVAVEIVTSITLPFIHDPDTYSGSVYYLEVPDDPPFSVIFTKANGDVIEKWIKKHHKAGDGKQMIISYPQGGFVNLAMRKKVASAGER